MAISQKCERSTEEVEEKIHVVFEFKSFLDETDLNICPTRT